MRHTTARSSFKIAIRLPLLSFSSIYVFGARCSIAAPINLATFNATLCLAATALYLHLDAPQMGAITGLSYPSISAFTEYHRTKISPVRPTLFPTHRSPPASPRPALIRYWPWVEFVLGTYRPSKITGINWSPSLPFPCRPTSFRSTFVHLNSSIGSKRK